MKDAWRVTLLYAALTFLLAYPLTMSPASTVLADDPDAHLFLWTLGWDAHAFLHQPLSIFDANIFYPQRFTLAYSENLIGSAFIAAPVIWLTGNYVLALNVVVLLSCVLCGLGVYVLAAQARCRGDRRHAGGPRLRVLTDTLLSSVAIAPGPRPVGAVHAGLPARVSRWRAQA